MLKQTMHVPFGGARGPAICVRTARAVRAATVTALSKEKDCHKIIHQHRSRDDHPNIVFCGGENNHRLEHSFLNLLLSDADSEERRDLARSTDSEDSEAAARWKCLQRQRE